MSEYNQPIKGIAKIMKNITMTAVLVLLTGCGGGGEFSTAHTQGGSAGSEGGEAGVGAGGSAGTAMGGSAGEAGGSVGGSAGDANGGTGGEVCVPKTCEDIAEEEWGGYGPQVEYSDGTSEAVACGMVGDGCGNALDCGTCPDNYRCGQDDLSADSTANLQKLIEGKDNLCGGGCLIISTHQECDVNFPKYHVRYGCYYPNGDTPPAPDCILQSDHTSLSLDWCCLP